MPPPPNDMSIQLKQLPHHPAMYLPSNLWTSEGDREMSNTSSADGQPYWSRDRSKLPLSTKRGTGQMKPVLRGSFLALRERPSKCPTLSQPPKLTKSLHWTKRGGSKSKSNHHPSITFRHRMCPLSRYVCHHKTHDSREQPPLQSPILLQRHQEAHDLREQPLSQSPILDQRVAPFFDVSLTSTHPPPSQTDTK